MLQNRKRSLPHAATFKQQIKSDRKFAQTLANEQASELAAQSVHSLTEWHAWKQRKMTHPNSARPTWRNGAEQPLGRQRWFARATFTEAFQSFVADDENASSNGAPYRVLAPAHICKYERKPGLVAETCAICITDFKEGDETRILPCLHKFHASEIAEWEQICPCATCPLCKTPM